MKTYLTLPEMFKALGEGKKIRNIEWPSDNYWMIKDNVIVTESGVNIFNPYFHSSKWEIFTEEKKPTKLYGYVMALSEREFTVRVMNEPDFKHEGFTRAPQFDTEVTLEN